MGETIFSILLLGKKFQMGLSNAIMAVFFLSGINLSIFLPLNPAIYRIVNAPKFLCPRFKEQDRSVPPFYLLLQDFQNYPSLIPTTQSLSHNGNFI